MPGRAIRILIAAACAMTFMSVTAPANAEDDPAQNLQWGLAKVRAVEAWGRSAGAGTSIAIIDSGVDLSHVEFADRLLPGADFTDSGSYQDDCGHGTHVAGIAAAAAGNGHGGAGVAPAAKIIPVKVLSPDGDGCSGTRAADGIRWAADQGATVINISLGGDAQFILGPSFSAAVRYAWEKGSIPVASAGNNGFVFPSGFDREPAVVVVATDMNDQKAYYSSDVGGAQWGMAAPGGNGRSDETKDIFSTYWRDGEPNAYAYVAGTSMAAPFVSGAAAVLRSLGLTKEQTVETLRATAVRGRCGASQCGAGLLDIAAAVATVPAVEGPPGGTPSTAGVVAPPSSRSSGPRRPPVPAPGSRRPSSSTAGDAGAPQPAAPTGPVVPDSNLADEAAAGSGTIGIGEDSREERPWTMVTFASSILAVAGAWAAVASRREYTR